MSDVLALDIRGLSKVYKGKRGARIEALRDLTMQVAQGEVFGFLGPNGAGKSTTIKCLMGLIHPSGGSATIMGDLIGCVSSCRKVGFLPENPAFYDYLTAEEYLTFVGSTFGMANHLLMRRLEDSLKLLELWDARKRPMRGYSKGMVQRVGLAQALIHDPDLYILDEPMSGLDPIGRALVKEIILNLKNRGKAVFFSTHITDDVEKICDRVAVIVKGKLEALDRVENILWNGIDGYTIQLTKDAVCAATLKKYAIHRATDSYVEYFVSTSDFTTFISAVSQLPSEILLIEARRKNLESFFLDIIEKRNKV